jgi:hypothetical protein
MYLCIAQITAMLAIIRQALFRVRGIVRCGPAHTLRTIAVECSRGFTDLLCGAVVVRKHSDRNSDSQSDALLCPPNHPALPGPHHKCHAPARQRNACVGTEHTCPWGASRALRPLFGVRAANLGIRALALPRPVRMLCVPHRQRHQKFLAARPAGPNGETGQA